MLFFLGVCGHTRLQSLNFHCFTHEENIILVIQKLIGTSQESSESLLFRQVMWGRWINDLLTEWKRHSLFAFIHIIMGSMTIFDKAKKRKAQDISMKRRKKKKKKREKRQTTISFSFVPLNLTTTFSLFTFQILRVLFNKL